jgi:hypothetical protein
MKVKRREMCHRGQFLKRKRLIQMLLDENQHGQNPGAVIFKRHFSHSRTCRRAS